MRTMTLTRRGLFATLVAAVCGKAGTKAGPPLRPYHKSYRPARTWFVSATMPNPGPDSRYFRSTIAAAMHEARPGDTIIVWPDTHFVTYDTRDWSRMSLD